MNSTRENPSKKRRMRQNIGEIASCVLAGRITGLLFSFLLLITGFFYGSDRLLLMALYFAVLSFSKNYLLRFYGERNKARRQLVFYQDYRRAASVLLAAQALMLVLLIWERDEEVSYPAASAVLVTLFLAAKVLLFLKSRRAYRRNPGSYALCARLVELGEILTAGVFLLHIGLLLTGAGQDTAGRGQLLMAAVFGILAMCSVCMLLLALSGIRSCRSASRLSRSGRRGRKSPAA